MLVGTNATLAGLLAARRWREAFVDGRAAWAQTRAYLIGHAALEKLLRPWPGITAKCLFIAAPQPPDEGSPPAWLDEAIAEVWRSGRITRPVELFPMPVLGIPGWWPDNGSAAFYDNPEIFRPARG